MLAILGFKVNAGNPLGASYVQMPLFKDSMLIVNAKLVS